MRSMETIVIGAGQAGLAASYELAQRGVDHVVLEKDRIGAGWANRWEDFCLVTPNWSVQLPGFAYDGDDADGFMPRDDIVAYLERYAASFDCPVQLGADVTGVSKDADGSFRVDVKDGDALQARNLIISTGAYQKPFVPNAINELPDHLRVWDATEFNNDADLPAGDILIIGSGQTGCQLAEELFEAGRTVVLACGRAPWFLRRIAGKDLMWWLIESGFLDVDATTLPAEARLFANIMATGHGGGHDIHYRTLADMGVTLAGRFVGVEGNTAQFAPNLADCVAWGDEKFGLLRDHFATFAKSRGLDFPDIPDPEPFETEGIKTADLSRFGAAILTGGFRPDYASWLPWPDAFDDEGFPKQVNGASTVVPGLYYVGLHFMRKRKSALLCGVGEDAG
ncbi:MAG: flavin-containing monooxygenase, partial [Ruegeria sp.]